jgi:signal peptidase I
VRALIVARPSRARRAVGGAAAVLALVLATLAAAFAVLAVRVDGVSMQPSFADGERVLLRPFSGGDTPARFAVVVGRFTDRGPTVVKRVVGLPGDRVRIDGARVEVQPGGSGPWFAVDNPAWSGHWGSAAVHCCRPTGQTGAAAAPQPVPPGFVFLLGDNPTASEDSRTFGWAPIRLVDGVVRWRLRAWVFPAGVRTQVQLRAIS